MSLTVSCWERTVRSGLPRRSEHLLRVSIRLDAAPGRHADDQLAFLRKFAHCAVATDERAEYWAASKDWRHGVI